MYINGFQPGLYSLKYLWKLIEVLTYTPLHQKCDFNYTGYSVQ